MLPRAFVFMWCVCVDEFVFPLLYVTCNPLSLPFYLQYTSVITLLLANGARVNVQDNGGRTPLHMAAWEGHYDVVVRVVHIACEH